MIGGLTSESPRQSILVFIFFPRMVVNQDTGICHKSVKSGDKVFHMMWITFCFSTHLPVTEKDKTIRGNFISNWFSKRWKKNNKNKKWFHLQQFAENMARGRMRYPQIHVDKCGKVLKLCPAHCSTAGKRHPCGEPVGTPLSSKFPETEKR